MLKNYIITALRTFKKNKTYTLLNIFGLGLGLACSLVVYTLIHYEQSFDQWHTKKDWIFRVVSHYKADYGDEYGGIVNYAIGDAIRQDITGVEQVAQFHGPDDAKFSFTDSKGEFQIFREKRVLYADTSFLQMLDFKILQGADLRALADPYKVFLTEKVAKKYFGDENPIGRTLSLENTTKLDIVGIIQDIPNNTNLPFDILISYRTFAEMSPWTSDQWGMQWAGSVYVMLPEGTNQAEIEEKFLIFKEKYLDEESRDKTFYKLQPLAEIHTDEKYGDGAYYVAPAMMLNSFIFLAALLLGTGCLNFINLSTAQAIRRSKEVGIRKTLGGSKSQLAIQFLAETFIIVLVAMAFAFTFGQFLLQGFNSLITQVNYQLTFGSEVIGFALLLSLVVTFLAGFYPAIIIAGYQPVKALKNQITLTKGSGSFNLRRSLVVLQFAFANILLISTVIISAQMDFIRSKDLGFDPKNIVLLNFPDTVKIDAVKSAFESKSYIESVSRTFGPPQYTSNWSLSFSPLGETHVDGNATNLKFIDEAYLDHYGLRLLYGENLREQVINDSTHNILVNEKLLQKLNWSHEEAIGHWIDMGYYKGKIVGVVNDFHNWQLNREIGAVSLMYKPDQMSKLSLKLKGDEESVRLPDIEATFREYYPNELFESTVLETQIKDRYMLENLMHKIIQLISVLSILISIMGLYGLVSFMANRNAKNIGIRKVFGASVGSILGIFGKEYLILLILAFGLSVPLTYWMMNEWVSTFAYHIPLTWFYFMIGFLISLAIAMLAVGYRSYIAAIANPTRSLRYE